MTGRSYTVEMPAGVTPEQGLELVRSKAGEVGIQIDGDERSGAFRGVAEGTYRLEAGSLTLAIASKPAFVPWSMIESGLRRVFGEVRPNDPA